jgi:hypothetical protein
MLNVFLTVDTEVWPLLPDWREAGLSADINRDVYGVTSAGEYGISYQMAVLSRYGLKGVFFVEPLFAEVAGPGPLRAIVAEIRDKGHEVQCHLHPEWLGWMEQPLLPGRPAGYLKDFSDEDQALLIAKGLANLRAAGTDGVRAFRAGDYAANLGTLRALAKSGIDYDTSHNTCYLGSRCGLETPKPILQPQRLEGVYEFPIAFFRDWPGHYRHAQLAACSWGELQAVLLQAWRRGWHSFVLVSHSFELLKPRRRTPQRPLPDKTVIRRFEHLCRFLGENNDKFRTSGFADLAPDSIPATSPPEVLSSAMHVTVHRWAEQILRRVV